MEQNNDDVKIAQLKNEIKKLKKEIEQLKNFINGVGSEQQQ